MTTRSKVYCSSCGGGNSAEEKFCSTCGSTMGMVNAPAAPTTTVVREGVVATGVQHVGYTGASIVAILTLLVTIFGLGDVFGLRWGSRPVGFLTEIAKPAPGYIVGIVIVLILNASFFRLMAPRRRDVGMSAVRSYRRTLRTRDGIRLLLSPSGLRAGVVTVSLLWIGMGAMALFDFGILGDDGFDTGTGLYASIVLPILGVIATACLWPMSTETVSMDRRGVIIRG